MPLIDLGWNSFFDEHFEPYRKENLAPLRITRALREKYIAGNEQGEFACDWSGKFRFAAGGKNHFPTAGDWVAASLLPMEKKAISQVVLPKKSGFSRKSAGAPAEE